LTKLAFAFPEAEREIHGSHASFLIRKKTFAYFLNNHHGDGIVAIACKVLPGENAALAAAQPKRYHLPAYIGSRGWVALRLDLGKIDWSEVRELLLWKLSPRGPQARRRHGSAPLLTPPPDFSPLGHPALLVRNRAKNNHPPFPLFHL